MNSGQTAERVYDTLKRHIRERGFRPGARLDPARLADSLLSSVTPVRDALNRLTGEGLVETRTSDGFHLLAVDAPGLQDLYDWNGEVLALALRASPSHLHPVTTPAGLDAVERLETCFTIIAGRSLNAEHGRAVAGLNDRLRTARLTESEVLADTDAELIMLALAVAEDHRAELRRLIAAYHRRRRREAAAIVRALYRSPPTFAE